MILAIDPGETESAYLFMGMDGTIRDFATASNEAVLQLCAVREYHELIIEEVRSYNQRVGKSTFETIKWSARFALRATDRHLPVQWVGRKEVFHYWCEGSLASDAAIRSALEDRYGRVGTKKCRGALFGHDKHTLSALAIAGYWKSKLVLMKIAEAKYAT